MQQSVTTRYCCNVSHGSRLAFQQGSNGILHLNSTSISIALKTLCHLHLCLLQLLPCPPETSLLSVCSSGTWFSKQAKIATGIAVPIAAVLLATLGWVLLARIRKASYFKVRQAPQHKPDSGSRAMTHVAYTGSPVQAML